MIFRYEKSPRQRALVREILRGHFSKGAHDNRREKYVFPVCSISVYINWAREIRIYFLEQYGGRSGNNLSQFNLIFFFEIQKGDVAIDGNSIAV